MEELQEEDAVKEQCRCTPTPASRSAQGRSNVYSQLSGLQDVVFNDFIKHDFIQEDDGQVASGSESLPDPVDLETDEHRLERGQNEHDVLEALGENESDEERLLSMCLRLLT